MKALGFLGAFVLLVSSTQVMAQTNTDCSNTGDQLSGTDISTLLAPGSGFNASGNTFALDTVDNNNESLVSTNQVWDYKLGGGADPSAQVGTYAITGGGAQGTITYTYGAASFPYNVSVQTSGGSHTAKPGTFLFCNGAKIVAVSVQVGHF